MGNNSESLHERLDKLEHDLLVTMTAVRTFASLPPASPRKSSLFGKFFDSDLFNLRAVAQAKLGFDYGEAVTAVRAVRASLLDALSLKPNSARAIGNLDALYAYLGDHPHLLETLPDKPTPDELQSARRRLKKMQALFQK